MQHCDRRSPSTTTSFPTALIPPILLQTPPNSRWRLPMSRKYCRQLKRFEMAQMRPRQRRTTCQKERGSGQRPERAVGGVAIRAERSSWELN